MKPCSKGGVEKLFAEFGKSSQYKDELQYRCKSCKAESGREYCLSHKEEIAEKRQTPAKRESQRKYNKKRRSTIRGHLETVFANMKSRCNNPKQRGYNRYGGRGIKVLFTPKGFIDYVTNELKVDPRGLQIDRVDNNGNYERGNIRFVTNLENQQNKG